MTLRDAIKPEVIHVLDILSPLYLEQIPAAEIEALKIRDTAGFDVSMKKALNVPFSKIARKHGALKSRAISSLESGALKTVAGAIDLTTAAAQGLPYAGE